MILAQIFEGEVDVAEAMFLIALILFVIGTVLAFQAKALWAALVGGGLAFVAFGWMLL